jgi:ABC-type glutathione transport system ATPase component
MQELVKREAVRETPDVTPVLECRNLSISYYTRAGEIPAVIDFNLKLMPGEAQGIVGTWARTEKSSVARSCSRAATCGP